MGILTKLAVAGLAGGLVGTVYMGGQTSRTVSEKCKPLPPGASQLCGVWEAKGAMETVIWYGTVPGVASFLLIYGLIKAKKLSPDLVTAIILVAMGSLTVTGWKGGKAVASGGAANMSSTEPLVLGLEQPPKIKALIDTIVFAEGMWKNGERVYDAAPSHPRKMRNFGGGLYSDAAGAVQALSTPYEEIQRDNPLDIPDFSPRSQVNFALILLKREGSLDAMNQGDVSKAIRLACPKWASLPCDSSGKGHYSQNAKPEKELIDFYNRRLKVYGE